MTELPQSLLPNSIKNGNEYGWKKQDVNQTLKIAEKENLACIGGEIQFIFPEGVCELYWRGFQPKSEKSQSQTWKEYVSISCEETKDAISETLSGKNLIEDGIENFDLLEKKHKEGINLEDHLVFILYFMTEDEYGRK